MFERRDRPEKFAAAAETGRILAAERPGMTRPALTRTIARPRARLAAGSSSACRARHEPDPRQPPDGDSRPITRRRPRPDSP